MTQDVPASLSRVPLAHRALHDVTSGRPENSRAAIRAALEAGYGMEIDLQLSADGDAMVFHDYDLSRLTAATGPVRQHSTAALARIPLTGGDGEGSGDSSSGDASSISIGDETRFRGWDPNGGATPDLTVETFVFDQDANITVLVDEANPSSPLPDIDVHFEGRAPGVYGVRSMDGSIQITLDTLDDDGEPLTDLESRLPLARERTVLDANRIEVVRLDGLDLELDRVFHPDAATDENASQKLEVRSESAVFAAVDNGLDGVGDDGVTPVPLPDVFARVVSNADGEKGLFLYGFAGEELDDRTGDPVPEPLDVSDDATADDMTIPSFLRFEQDATFASAVTSRSFAVSRARRQATPRAAEVLTPPGDISPATMPWMPRGSA